MSTEQERAELLPCPFCGSTNIEIQISTPDREGVPTNLMCSDCGASGPWEYEQDNSHAKADAAWNRRAALQSQDRDDAAHAEWMVDDGRAPWAVNSLKTLIKEMRATEKQCRNAFRKDYMRVVSEYFADALGEAAEALEKRLSTIDHARRIEGEA